MHKPLFSREGQNVTLNLGGLEGDLRTTGAYGDLPVVKQAYTELLSFPHPDGRVRYPVLGIWVAGLTVCGMGVRESNSRITDNRASFVPHLILADA